MFPLVNYFQKLQLKVPPPPPPPEKWENRVSLAGSHTATRTTPVFASRL